LNIFSAPEAEAPELAAPEAPDEAPGLEDSEVLGAALLPAELPLDALSPAAWIESGIAKAAATAAAIRVLSFTGNLLEGLRRTR
jgi:hypothetical protein